MNVRWAFRCLSLAALTPLTLGCAGTDVDITKAFEVTELTTGWLDVGFDEFGRNKLVPTVSFQLENVSGESLRIVQLNGVFRRCLVAYAGQPEPASDVSPADPTTGTCHGETEVWGNVFLRAVGRDGLEPALSAGPFTMQSDLGYTGEQPRLEMLRHRSFVDAKVEIFIKHGSDQWVRFNEYPIERQLLTQ